MESRTHPSVLVVAPHPDDEVLLAGAWMAHLSTRGVSTAVLLMTAGEGGGDPQRRLQEAECAAAALSSRVAGCLGAPDGQVASWLEDGGTDRLRAAIDAVDPTVVVTWGPAGGYGHPDHLATTEALANAAAERPLLGAVHPRTLWKRAHRRSQREPAASCVHIVERQAEATAGDWVAHTNETARRLRREALACHRSQAPARGWPAFLGGAWGQWPREERFRLLQGHVEALPASTLGLKEVPACASFM